MPQYEPYKGEDPVKARKRIARNQARKKRAKKQAPPVISKEMERATREFAKRIRQKKKLKLDLKKVAREPGTLYDEKGNPRKPKSELKVRKPKPQKPKKIKRKPTWREY
jgi:hypothetical protein|tara:strand:- start:12478 stop:12804 length:327 start_codon:yes stop_codon:yes gene_type:complete